MADTGIGLLWSLERPCAFRSGDQWFLPGQTFTQLHTLQAVDSSLANGRIVQGICVTSHYIRTDSLGREHEFPCSGFRIADRSYGMGSLEDLLATCRNCEANAEGEPGRKVAGCAGYLGTWPYSGNLHRRLWEIIQQRNLEDRLRSLFPVTRPLWFGFWIHSPLSQRQCEFLFELLIQGVWRLDHPGRSEERHFLNALEAAIRSNLPLHVRFSAPGHTDFGLYREFPHCPRCKAGTPGNYWHYLASKNPHTCQVCGHSYIPSDHDRYENMDSSSDENDDLKTQLGEESFRKFVGAYLLHRGCEPHEVEWVIQGKRPWAEILKRLGERARAELEAFLFKHLGGRKSDQVDDL